MMEGNIVPPSRLESVIRWMWHLRSLIKGMPLMFHTNLCILQLMASRAGDICHLGTKLFAVVLNK